MTSSLLTQLSPTHFNGSRVVSFESRRAQDIATLIEKQQGVPVMAPTMRELPLDAANQAEALQFARDLKAGEIDCVIFLTGVGARMLKDAVSAELSEEDFFEALGKVRRVARGPKPLAVLREWKLKPHHTVQEPNTWEDLIEAMDALASQMFPEAFAMGGKDQPLKDVRIAIQEYGMTNEALVDALKTRGAKVNCVRVYRWGLPEDVSPLKSAIESLVQENSEIDFALFLSATQVFHLFEVAETMGYRDALMKAFGRVAVGSIGPIATDALQQHGIHPDFEPDGPHMSELVRELARRGHDLRIKKRLAANAGIDTGNWQRIDMTQSAWCASHSDTPDAVATGIDLEADADLEQARAWRRQNSVFLKACLRQPVPYTPVWIMRQAGRYQRAYREMRKGIDMLTLCKSPELSAEITLMAVDRLGVDAAIVFADILPIVEPFGINLKYVKGDGPVLEPTIRDRTDLNKIAAYPDLGELTKVFETVKLTRQALRPDIALIGFAGSPFTVASYLIEGGKSSNYKHTKAMMHADSVMWHDLMSRLVKLTSEYLCGQIDAGADALQLFDSWAGSLAIDDYQTFILPHMKALISEVKQYADIPIINFATGNPMLLPELKKGLLIDGKTRAGDVVGLDWRVPLDRGWQMLRDEPGGDVAVMGNLDPTLLYSTPAKIREKVQSILDLAQGRDGHIFNLGHGLSPDMNPTYVAELVQSVHELSSR